MRVTYERLSDLASGNPVERVTWAEAMSMADEILFAREILNVPHVRLAPLQERFCSEEAKTHDENNTGGWYDRADK